MKYISIDIETTGLSPTNDQILTVGAIIEDSENKRPFEELPKFHVALLHGRITGSPYALNMNKHIIQNMNTFMETKDEEKKKQLQTELGLEFVQPREVAGKFWQFLFVNGLVQNRTDYVTVNGNGEILPVINNTTKAVYITVAGKNFGTFDKLFLENLPNWSDLIKFRTRILDPSILFIDWNSDKEPPSLQKCKDRAKIEGKVSHDAVEDAWDVVQLLRTQY